MPVKKKTKTPGTNSPKDPHFKKAHAYALDVTTGKIPACKWVIAACRRHLSDLEKQKGNFPYRFDESLGGRICRYIEQLPHIKGPKAGQNIELESFQCFILVCVFGWVRKDNGKRRFRRAYIEVPRGNAKSTLSSGVGLYCLTADGEGGAEVYSAATTRDQARIVFSVAQQMVRKRPQMMASLGAESHAHAISVIRSASKFEALSAEGNSLDGLNIHVALVDELHAHKTRDVYDVLETGTGKREQSLLWTITTAGSNRAGICYEVRTYLTKLLDGVFEDDSFFGIIYTIDDADDWTDPAIWVKANPCWGVSVMPDVVAQLAQKAMQMPAAQNNFKTKHLNVWVNADTAWMDMQAWDRCADPTLSIDNFAGQPCIIGLDLASKTDVAAKMRIFTEQREDGPHYFVFGSYYLPEAAVTDGRNSQYAGWEIEGRLITTPGDVLDFEAVKSEILDDSSRFTVQEIGYDPWQATQLAQQLQAEGATMVEYRNTVANFSAPMKEIDALVRSGRLHHDGDPVLAWMVSNVVCHIDAKENIYPRKERPENKIDGVVALITALGRSMAQSGPQGTIYDSMGVMSV